MSSMHLLFTELETANSPHSVDCSVQKLCLMVAFITLFLECYKLVESCSSIISWAVLQEQLLASCQGLRFWGLLVARDALVGLSCSEESGEMYGSSSVDKLNSNCLKIESSKSQCITVQYIIVVQSQPHRFQENFASFKSNVNN